MAATLRGELTEAKEYLSRFTPYEDSFIAVSSTALRAIWALTSGEPHKEELLRELQDQLHEIRDFDYSLSPLRHLEEGLARRSQPAAERADIVFALLTGRSLRSLGSPLNARPLDGGNGRVP